MLGVVELVEGVPRTFDFGDGKSCVIRGESVSDGKIQVAIETVELVTAEHGLDDVPIGSPLTATREFTMQPGTMVTAQLPSRELIFTPRIVSKSSPAAGEQE